MNTIMSGVINYLLDLVRVPSDVIVVGSDDSPKLRKAEWYERLIYFIPSSEKFFVYDSGLRRLLTKITGLTQDLAKEKPNSNESEILVRKITSVSLCMENAINATPANVSKKTAEEVHAIVAGLFADKLMQEAALILNELAQAFVSKNNDVLYACIEKMNSFIKRHPDVSVSHIPNFAYNAQKLVKLCWVIKTRDYKTYPVTDLYDFLIALSKERAIAFCEELRDTFPSQLRSLPNISDKLSALQGITLPHEYLAAFNRPKKIEQIVNLLVVEQMDTLLKDIDTELKTNPTGLDKKQLVKILQEHICPSYEYDKEFLTQLAKYCPALLDEFLHYRLCKCIEMKVVKSMALVDFHDYDACRHIAEENHLSLPKLSDDHVIHLNGLFDQMLTNSLGLQEYQRFNIFPVSETCKWMKEVYGISPSPLSQALFESIKQRLPEVALYRVQDLTHKGISLPDAKLRLAGLIRELPLTKDQIDELVKMLEAIKL